MLPCFFCKRDPPYRFYLFSHREFSHKKKVGVQTEEVFRETVHSICIDCAKPWLVKEDDDHWVLRMPISFKTENMKKIIAEMERQMLAGEI